MNQMTAQYNLERAKLDASKAEVVSQIEGAKSRLDVGISEGELKQVKTVLTAHDDTQQADLDRLQQRKDKTVRDVDRAQELSHENGVDGSAGWNRQHPAELPRPGFFGYRAPCLSKKETGPGPEPRLLRSPISANMRIDLKLEEVDRGKIEARTEGPGSYRCDR